MKLRSALALALFLGTTALGRADPTPTVAGLWETDYDDGSPRGWFLFTQKNEVYSARLVKGFKKPGDTSPPPSAICTECPGDKKGARIMGLTLFWGMKRDGLNYNDGHVIDPRDGSVYNAKMWLDEDGKTLHVRGYLGLSLFGQTQDWKRLPDDAMKKEDMPKELLANALSSDGVSEKPRVEPEAKPAVAATAEASTEQAPADTTTPEKSKKKPASDTASADKPKSHKKKPNKPKTDPDAAPGSSDVAPAQ